MVFEQDRLADFLELSDEHTQRRFVLNTVAVELSYVESHRVESKEFYIN